MKNHAELAETLRGRMKERAVTQQELREAAGLSKQTLTHVLNAQRDYKVSTLFALADRLGLELVLVPKEAAAGLQAGQPTAPAVTTAVAAALEKVRGGS